MIRRVALALATLALAACGSSDPSGGSGGGGSDPAAATPQAHPQVIQPTAGSQAAAIAPSDPVGDIHAHAPPLSQIRAELKQALVYAPVNSAGYIDPLRFVSVWERTDQGVDASMPVGAPILAPSRVKILAVEPGWYAASRSFTGSCSTVRTRERCSTSPSRSPTSLGLGAISSRDSRSLASPRPGTGIEFGWSTINGITLAMATTGYEEGQVTPAGLSMRRWLNSLGANAGYPGPP